MSIDADVLKAIAELDVGNADAARALAHSTLAHAAASRDPHAEAKALACLANCDRLASRFRRAHYASKRAAKLFEDVGDTAGQASALATYAHAASVLGRNEEAVDAALASIQLASELGNMPLSSIAHVQLGIAYLFSRAFERAHAALDESIRLSQECAPPLSPFQARVTQGCTELVRIITERASSQLPASSERLQKIASVCRGLAETGQTASMAPGVHVSLQAMCRLVSALDKCWRADVEGAKNDLCQARRWIAAYGLTTSLHAFGEIVDTELAIAAKDWALAQHHSVVLIEVATATEHEQFALIGHVLASYICEMQGNYEGALRFSRAMAVRECNVRREGLADRADSARWRFETRPSLCNVQR